MLMNLIVCIVDSETQTAPKASRVDGEALLQEIWATELPEDSYDDYGVRKLYYFHYIYIL